MKWSRKDVWYLREMFPIKPTAQVARWMGRTPATVAAKARSLGLQKSEKYLDANPLKRRQKAHLERVSVHRFSEALRSVIYLKGLLTKKLNRMVRHEEQN